jgi:hypothetical protein
VIDALVEHFMSFINEERQLPVLWHQALLVFVQRYKEDMTPNQKAQVRQLFKRQHHHSISSEILRELNESKSRGEGGQQASTSRTCYLHFLTSGCYKLTFGFTLPSQTNTNKEMDM